MRSNLLLIIFFIVFPVLSIFAQENDAGMWNTFSIEKELTKKLSLCVDEELRLKENYTQLNLLYTNLGITYKVIKGFKAGFTYRFIEKYLDQGWFSYRNRLMLDLSYKYKIKSFSISYRSRLQSEVRNYFTSEKGKVAEWFWRNKFEAKYTINNYIPYVGTELRYQIKDQRNPTSDLEWHRIRLFAGLDYKINSNNTIGVYYLIQKEDGIINPQTLYILGLQYVLELPQ
ncbi:MAG: DUF2490 domain-containing protein [Bacteroidia bacterium]|nr:DUF2490 domain-containing protein [Bacteroidia bacterium]